MASLITMLLVLDLAGHYAIYNKRQTFADIIHVVVERGNLLLLLPFFFFLALLALVIDYNTALSISQKFLTFARSIKEILLDWRSLIVIISALLFLFFVKNMFRMIPLSEVFSQFCHYMFHFLKDQLRTLLPVIALLVATVLGYLVFSLLGKVLLQTSLPREVFIEWNVGTTILFVLVATAGFCRFHIAHAADIDADKWMDILKDYSVYFLLGVVYVGGLTKWANSEGARSPNADVYLVVALLGCLLCAIALVFLDFMHISTLKVSKDPRYQIIKVFIYLRDVAVLVPLCLAQAVFLVWRVAVAK
jgi:hypothetical protein